MNMLKKLSVNAGEIALSRFLKLVWRCVMLKSMGLPSTIRGNYGL